MGAIRITGVMDNEPKRQNVATPVDLAMLALMVIAPLAYAIGRTVLSLINVAISGL
jgi:hypothetical protein